MANQIKKKFIGADQVGASQLLIEKNQAVRIVDSSDATIDLLKLNTSDEVILGGYKIIDSAGFIPSAVLPSYVDDVLEYADLASFPVSGETGKIYVAIDTSKCYRWSGSAYIQITSGAVDSVNGQTGVVSLDTDDISEGSTNLYFTDSRAKTAAVSDSITDGVTDVAPSQNAVFDALALKKDSFVWAKEKITLVAGDITAQYVDLAHLALTSSIMVFVDRVAAHETEDYTVSTVSSKSRITFAGDLATGGSSALVAGDNLFVKYCY